MTSSESTNPSPLALTDLLPEEIGVALGLKPYQGQQIFQWLHRKGVFDFDAMTNLPKALRADLAGRCVAGRLRLVSESTSSRAVGTRKVLLALDDGETVEAVLIRDRDRVTLCLSSQVGCAVKCAFCATGQFGFSRNLSPGEIAEQALYLLRGQDLEARTPNVVFMGMGEPFRNYEAMVKSIRLLNCKHGLGIGARKITVSTVGDVPGIERFAQEDWQVRLSISLHAANDRLRSELVPLNRKYPLEALIRAVKLYVANTGRQVTFEWTLLKGVNDRLSDAKELVELVRGIKASVNLIPYNPVHGLEFRPSQGMQCRAFRDALNHAGIKATLRKERGQDIDAACGQLRRRQGALAGQDPQASGESAI